MSSHLSHTTDRIGAAQLFFSFTTMSLSGFGGVMPFAYRHIVERKRWFTATEFTEMVALAQVLPGPTICNVSIMVGWRKAGLAGAFASLAGMICGPAAVVLALGIAYQNTGHSPRVQAALTGMSAVAAGLILATALKMAQALIAPASATPAVTAVRIGLGLVALLSIGWARLPLVLVVALLGPVAIFWAWRTQQS